MCLKLLPSKGDILHNSLNLIENASKRLKVTFNQIETLSPISFQNSFFYLGWPDDESLSANPDLTAVLKTRRRQKFHPPKQRSKAGEGGAKKIPICIPRKETARADSFPISTFIYL
jgi:hypothetical protein